MNEQDQSIIETLRRKLSELLPEKSEQLDDADRRRAASMAALQFESFVVEVLRRCLEEPGGSAASSAFSQPGPVDLIANTSICDLPAPTAFEIRFIGWQKRSARELTRLAREIGSRVKPQVRSFVLVTNVDPSEEEKYSFQLESSLDFETDGVPIADPVSYLWWGPTEISRVLESLGDEGREIVESLPVAALSAALRKASRGATDTWKSSRNSIVSELHTSWKDDQLVFFLGAGVSIDAGVPLWGNLLSSLYERLITGIAPNLSTRSPTTSIAEAVETLLSLQDNSPLMNARTLRSGLQSDFLDSVRSSLYSASSVTSSRQLFELARLCDPPRGRLGARAVVTYNFDDLLEQKLQSLNVDHVSICTPASRPGSTQLPIYHVHGLIPQANPIPVDQTLVFSEEGYHLAYNNPYTWSNVVQLNLMTQYTCIFVGLSMTDPNLRRLLEIASIAQSGPRHVALLRRTQFKGRDNSINCPSTDPVCGIHAKPPVSKLVVDSVLAIHHNAWETTMKELGVRILWFEEFHEIPGILSRIRTG